MNHNSFPTGEQATKQQNGGDTTEFPSFEEHMQRMGQQKDYKDRYFDDAMRRDANSRERLDYAAAQDGLSPERQEEILNAEIAVEAANDELLKELASDSSTEMSALAKNIDVGQAQSEAIGTTIVKTIQDKEKQFYEKKAEFDKKYQR